MSVYDTQQLEKISKETNFRFIDKQEFPYLQRTIFLFEHCGTGAKLAHIDTSDKNNCFAVAFRTPPQDSTGVSHILEHIVLCGSKAYPVKDPFFSMLRRSLNTFMNAFTAPDWTMYPFATQNETDYYNLLSVYMDAVFYPLLQEESFLQEGHRLEVESKDGKEFFKMQGVVFNEMKGAMSEQSSIMERFTQQKIFPTTTYNHNSGGEPLIIPSLTWQQLRYFHKAHYHPSNSWFYTYGSFPLAKRMEAIDKVLRNFERITPQTMIPDEKRYTSPQNFQCFYPLEQQIDDEKEIQVGIHWLTCKITETLEVLSLEVLDDILLGNAASPLRKQLITSKLGKDLADTSGYHNDYRETFFGAGLQGIRADQCKKVEQLILNCLADIAEKGVPQKLIDVALHQKELSAYEISGGRYPYGLRQYLEFFGLWMHGGDIFYTFDVERQFKDLREKMEGSSFLEQQIEKYFLNNQHRVRIELYPQYNFQEQQEQQVTEIINQKVNSFTEEDKKNIKEKSQKLVHYQNQRLDDSVLPFLELRDIPVETEKISFYEKKQHGETEIILYQQPTNGIIHFNISFPLNTLDESERELLPFLASILTKTGTEKLNYEELTIQTNLSTGGFVASPHVFQMWNDERTYHDSFSIGSCCLEKKYSHFFDVLEEILFQWSFQDISRIQDIINQRATSLVNSILSSGHSYACSLAGSQLRRANNIQEIYGGIHHVKLMKTISQSPPERLKQLVRETTVLTKKILSCKNISFTVISSEQLTSSQYQRIENFCDRFSGCRFIPEFEKKEVFQQKNVQEVLFVASSVNYIAHVYKTPFFHDVESPKLHVLANLLLSNYIHTEIREKGGAYGGMVKFQPSAGIFAFLSYRDPHFKRTQDIFQKAERWVQQENFTDKEIREAILKTFSAMDIPLSPVEKAFQHYIEHKIGVSLEMKNQYRERLLNVKKDDLLKVSERWLQKQPYSQAAVVGKQTLENETQVLKNWNISYV